jgi:exosortase
MSLATRRLLSVGLTISAVVLLYWPTVVAYSTAWTDFDNKGNTHGYLIVLLCLVLLYLRRAELTSPLSRPSPVAFVALALLGLAWLLAYRAGIQTAHEVLFPLIVWSAIYTVFGAQMARTCFFPVVFLYFALPFWGLINGLLQAMTIGATRVILSLFQLPVDFYGNLVHIPEGTFAIEGGCSGLHFFIIGLALAAYYGELHRDSARNRTRLLLLAGALALLANWIRVSVVISAGHLTHMQSHLVRVSHYGFGWAVFAVAMALFFLLASRIPAASHAMTSRPATSPRSAVWPGALGIMLAFAALALGPALAWVAGRVDSTAVARSLPLVPVRGWSASMPSTTSWKPIFIGADSERLAIYRRGALAIEWYTADYVFQRQGRKLLGYDNSVLGSDRYTVINQSVVRRAAHRFVELTVQDGDGAEFLLWYFYDVGGYATTSGLRAALWYGMTSLATPVGSRFLAFRTKCEPDCTAARTGLELFVQSICEDASRFDDCRRDR